MIVENEYAIKSLQSNAIFGLNEHEMKKATNKLTSAGAAAAAAASSLLLTAKTKLLVESLVEMNSRVCDSTLEIVFFSSSIRNFSIKQILVELFSRK